MVGSCKVFPTFITDNIPDILMIILTNMFIELIGSLEMFPAYQTLPGGHWFCCFFMRFNVLVVGLFVFQAN